MVLPDPSLRVAGFQLDDAVVKALEEILPAMAERTVTAITLEVPSYADAFSGRMGQNIENAVQTSLGAFLRLVTRAHGSDPGPPLSPALDGAYELGRGEARQGRSIDALLSAYRVGARVAWRQMSTTVVEAGLPAPTIAKFAELVFAYIDELSAASASGHTDELATTGRVRQRYLDRLTLDLLAGEPAATLLASADKASWQPPETLTAVLIPSAQTRGLAARFGQSTLQLSEDLPGVDVADSLSVLLIPDMTGTSRRAALLSALSGRAALVGPARPWMEVRSSYRRALRARDLLEPSVIGQATPVDTDDHLVELVLGADREAADDLRARALAPLAELPPNTADRLTETLRSWVLHQGRREAVAADLFVHAQTVRYRMTQLRKLYGDRLNDPQTILELTVALGSG
ncbi:transcriptional regulator [Mycobacterium intermedium]|uniref:Transcriptional regulator n=1 Tax=Mycobacterium intermedium TaxID=28445 RepID=A0A1E3S634_MYCIE|nr:transcriptional regulator [Mycobacterium intermedium]OPE47825.1 transcriptional regulator [Mycobacterium intermedium]ORA95408.1 transcriptional regulator [Mycobacterium intermedium]